MISIKKPGPPAILVKKGQEAAARLCEAYLRDEDNYIRGTKTFDFSNNIYAADQVKKSLKSIQYGKCAFCESIFTHIAFGDVEHFRPKAGYKQTDKDKLQRPGYFWLAYDWDNLFLSCQICNQQFKKNRFPLKTPQSRARSHLHDLSKETPLLIHPARDDIGLFVGFRKEYAYAIRGCKEGKTTIEVFGLNRDELVENRRKRLRELDRLVSTYHALRDAISKRPNPGLSNHLRSIELDLQASQSDSSEYAHMTRAYLFNLSLPL